MIPARCRQKKKAGFRPPSPFIPEQILFIDRVPASVQLHPVHKPDHRHDQVNAFLRKVDCVEMGDVHCDRNDVGDDPPCILLPKSEKFN